MQYPKVDLHLHLDGSCDPHLSYELAKEYQMEEANCSEEEFAKKMIVDKNVKHLHDYLKCFDLPVKLLQDYKALKKCTRNLVNRIASQGVEYAEIRFAPQLHTKNFLTMEDSVRAVLDGVREGMADNASIEVNIILCMMIMDSIEKNHKENHETVLLAKKYLNNGVAAIDLAGPEGLTDLEEYRPYFELAKSLSVPFTIHAGESGPAENVAKAIELGAKRIGHGGHCLENEEIMQSVIANNVTLEMCPTSNIQCKNQPSYEKHALKDLYRAGVKTTINTDNMTLSSVTLEDEYEHVINEMALKETDIIQMNLNAIQASYASNEKKNRLIQIYEELLQSMKNE